MSVNVEEAKNDEIPPITYRNFTKRDRELQEMKKCAEKRTARFFISDIFNAECKLRKRYTLKGVDFRTVMICGVVVATYDHSDEKFVITVDDGTGEIDCFVESDKRLDDLKETVTKEVADVESQYKLEEPDDILLQASLMMLNSAKHTLKRVEYFKNFKLGDTVQIIGNLSDYKNKRYLFANSVVKYEENGADVRANYLNTLYDLYENVYQF